MAADVEAIIVGAGVVGLAAARALALRGHEVLVIERHERTGSETSSRNSEVVHAGLYYPPGSLRARMCVAGKEQLYRFSAESGVAVQRLGKLLVASCEEERPGLAAIAEAARRNGVTDLVMLSAAEAKAIEPELSCVAACLSPSTGIIDSHGLLMALEGHLAALGGQVQLRTAVTGIQSRDDGSFAVEIASAGEQTMITAERLVLTAGLGASALALRIAWPGSYRPPMTYLAKGHYYALTGRAPFRRLVYPLPRAGGLGIHFTLDIAGRAKFGPDIAWTDRLDYAFEDEDGARREAFERAIRRYWPGLPDGALQPGDTGLRPKLTRPGEAAADFTIHGLETHGVPGLVALYGIESPGLTSALAIGDYVAGRIGEGCGRAP